MGTEDVPSAGLTAADAQPPYESASPGKASGSLTSLNVPFPGKESFQGRTPQITAADFFGKGGRNDRMDEGLPEGFQQGRPQPSEASRGAFSGWAANPAPASWQGKGFDDGRDDTVQARWVNEGSRVPSGSQRGVGLTPHQPRSDKALPESGWGEWGQGKPPGKIRVEEVGWVDTRSAKRPPVQAAFGSTPAEWEEASSWDPKITGQPSNEGWGEQKYQDLCANGPGDTVAMLSHI